MELAFLIFSLMLINVSIISLFAQNNTNIMASAALQEVEAFLRPKADLSPYEIQLASSRIAESEVKLKWASKSKTKYTRFEIVFSVDYFKTSKFKYNHDRSSVDYGVKDISTQRVETIDQCVRACALNPDCYHYVFKDGICYLRGINYKSSTRRTACPNTVRYECGIIIDGFSDEAVNKIQYNQVVVYKIRLYDPARRRWTTYSNEVYSFSQYYYDDDHMQCTDPGYCYGFGDPHYRTFDGHNLHISNACTYILSSDHCDNKNQQYTYVVLANHERRYGVKNAAYIKSIDVFYENKEFLIDTDFKVNIRGTFRIVPLPYYSQDYKLRVYRSKNFIVFDSIKFNVQFDGIQLLKFRHNNKNFCGICGYTKDINQDDIAQLNRLNQLYMRPDADGKCLKA